MQDFATIYPWNVALPPVDRWPLSALRSQQMAEPGGWDLIGGEFDWFHGGFVTWFTLKVGASFWGFSNMVISWDEMVIMNSSSWFSDESIIDQMKYSKDRG